MADRLDPHVHRHLTDRALAAAYEDLVGLFARYDTPATFAFVMAFTLSASQRSGFRQLNRHGGQTDDWMRHFWSALERGDTQGWFQPHALDVVQADGRHEVACHGFCHRPLSDESVSVAAAEAELDAAHAVARLKGVALHTFIFPRNVVGHLPVLRRMGYIGYRARRLQGDGTLGRVRSVAGELNLHPRPQLVDTPAPGHLVRIPSGYFLNWRSGVRRAVPRALTVKRWMNLIDRAAAQGEVAHLWLHPHNLVTGPGTRSTLESILAYAAMRRAQGELDILTQEGYCRRILARSAGDSVFPDRYHAANLAARSAPGLGELDDVRASSPR